MSAPVADGFCASCEGHGPVGAPCVEATCLKRGYHHIPHAYRHVIDTRTVDPLIGQLWGDFLIVDRLGSGGVGNVYLALQQPIGLPAALKVLGQVETEDHEEERFRAEATALARLNHPNIVRLLKFGHHEDRPYLVMEYVQNGRTLKADMRKGMTAEAALAVVHQLVDALEAAHAAGVVHRDIKPANVMLQALAGRPHYVRLVDFGLAKFVDEGHSTRMMAGTPSYMAPEQLDRRNIGPWSDWYAVGCIAFELFTGQRPFPGRSSQEVIALKQSKGYRPTAQLVDEGLPPDLLRFFDRMLARDPADRPRTAAEVRAMLRSAVPRAAVIDRNQQGRQTMALAAVTDDTSVSTGSVHGAMHTTVNPPVRRRRPALWAMGAAAVVGAVTVLVLFGETGPPAPAAPTVQAGDTPAGRAAVSAGAVAVAQPSPPPDLALADPQPLDAGAPDARPQAPAAAASSAAPAPPKPAPARAAKAPAKPAPKPTAKPAPRPTAKPTRKPAAAPASKARPARRAPPPKRPRPTPRRRPATEAPFEMERL